MLINAHPLEQLDNVIVDTIRAEAAGAEKIGKLTDGLLNLAYAQQWFKILVPKNYTGAELSLPDEVRLIEALSWADGSLGWTVTLCCGAGWFGGFLDAGLSKQIFAMPNVCLAGSGAPAGTAEIVDGGYLISGHWNYASGALHATHFTANCYITKNQEKVMDDEGAPLVLPFIFDEADVWVIPAWDYIGLTATGSHSFKVENLLVTDERCFKIDPAFAVIDAPLYQYPFLQLAEATLAVNISGMAVHFIDMCRYNFVEKSIRKNLSATQQSELNDTLKMAINKINTARDEFYKAVDASWSGFIDQDTAVEELLSAVSKCSRVLAKTAIQLVDSLYPYCGLTAASKTTDINRVWRDVHTASQHALLTFAE